jgi:hypothetical protein
MEASPISNFESLPVSNAEQLPAATAAPVVVGFTVIQRDIHHQGPPSGTASVSHHAEDVFALPLSSEIGEGKDSVHFCNLFDYFSWTVRFRCLALNGP